MRRSGTTIAVAAGLAIGPATGADAQSPLPIPEPAASAPVSAAGPTLCGQPIAPPAQLPPAGSGPLVYVMGLCFPTQHNQSAVEPETYLYYLHLRPSRPSQGEWVTYDESTRTTINDDLTLTLDSRPFGESQFRVSGLVGGNLYSQDFAQLTGTGTTMVIPDYFNLGNFQTAGNALTTTPTTGNALTSASATSVCCCGPTPGSTIPSRRRRWHCSNCRGD